MKDLIDWLAILVVFAWIIVGLGIVFYVVFNYPIISLFLFILFN